MNGAGQGQGTSFIAQPCGSAAVSSQKIVAFVQAVAAIKILQHNNYMEVGFVFG
jgi:hypothetical protein